MDVESKAYTPPIEKIMFYLLFWDDKMNYIDFEIRNQSFLELLLLCCGAFFFLSITWFNYSVMLIIFIPMFMRDIDL